MFNPHHVNQGGVQKATPQVTLYETHTAEESLRRCRSGRHSQVLSVHAGQARELLHVLLPPHQRVCVQGHLLHSRVGIYPFFFPRGGLDPVGVGSLYKVKVTPKKDHLVRKTSCPCSVNDSKTSVSFVMKGYMFPLVRCD